MRGNKKGKRISKFGMKHRSLPNFLIVTVRRPQCPRPPRCLRWRQMLPCSIFSQEFPWRQKVEPYHLSFPDGWGVRWCYSNSCEQDKDLLCCFYQIWKWVSTSEPHLGLKLDRWTLLTLESAGLNGQGDLPPEESKKTHTWCSWYLVTVKTWKNGAFFCLSQYLPVFVWRRESDWTGAASCQSWRRTRRPPLQPQPEETRDSRWVAASTRPWGQ